MTVTCCIRYRIDPFQRDAFAEYVRTWLTVIPVCDGDLHGYRLPYEVTVRRNVLEPVTGSTTDG